MLRSEASCSYAAPVAQNSLSHKIHRHRKPNIVTRAFHSDDQQPSSRDDLSSDFDSSRASFDELSREFEQVAKVQDPQRVERLANHLDLLWSVSNRRSKLQECSCCKGTGLKECTWCHGTGALTVGDTLFCSNEGCRSCPVCKGSGDCTCERCRGTGKLAAWIRPESPESLPQ